MWGSTPRQDFSPATAAGCAARRRLAVATGVHGLNYFAAIVIQDLVSAYILIVKLSFVHFNVQLTLL